VEPPRSETEELERRLREAGAGHLRVDRLLGRSVMGSVYLALDTRRRQQMTIKVLDSDLAYDVGAEEYLRGIGDARVTTSPQVLGPAAGTEGQGTICYVSHFVPGLPLRDRLAQGPQLSLLEVLSIAADAASGLARWHHRGVAHGAIGVDTISFLSGQVVVGDPLQSEGGATARQRDVQALAALALELWDRARFTTDPDGRYIRLRAQVAALADPETPALMPAERLAEILRLTVQQSKPDQGASRSLVHRLITFMKRPS
jgi:hypothetical protein